MNNTMNEVLEFVKENDVKFIRLGFCDPFGLQKNISILPEELVSAFENGVSFDAHAVKGFSDVTQSDLLLFPDPVTLTVLPWRPGPGRVVRFYCDIKKPDGTAFLHDSRYLLKRVTDRARAMGYVCKVGAECEFYLFKTDDGGEPTGEPLDRGGYLDISPLDRGEDIRREICLSLEEMGIMPERSHHEQGPGQNEVDFKFSDAISCADNFLTLKSVVKSIAARGGLFASFMPKPLLSEAGSGMHINLSLEKNGCNIFSGKGCAPSPEVCGFIAGILSKAPEMSLFLNPIANSYERLGKFESPKYVSWSHQNRSQLVRIPAATGESARMELRSPDPALNPYLAFALILSAGLSGLEQKLSLPPATNADLYTANATLERSLTPLPKSLHEAICLARDSELVQSVIGKDFLSQYIEIKEREAADFAAAGDKSEFYAQRYFGYI